MEGVWWLVLCVVMVVVFGGEVDTQTPQSQDRHNTTTGEYQVWWEVKQ